MGFIGWLKGVIGKMFKQDAEKIFGTDIIMSGAMDRAIRTWYSIVGGRPGWRNMDDDVDTINFAKFITSDTAKKICLDIDINVDGSARAEYLQTVVDALKDVLRDKVEDACSVGGIMFKPNGSADVRNCIDYVETNDFLITDKNTNGDIKGCIFIDYLQIGDKHYKRLEYHRFVGEQYVITNRAYKSDAHDTLGKEVPLHAVTAWADMAPEVSIQNVTAPLFAYYKMPYNNTIDHDSPLGVSVFSNAIKELKDLDVAWSRKGTEVEDSKHMTFVSASAMQYADSRNIKLPRFVKGLDLGINDENTVHEHISTMLTEDRLKDINSILSMISTKCGFSQGQFVLDRKTGNVTATQVEADDRETIETIKDMRDALKDAIDRLLYALSVYADLYNLAPVGKYEASYAFGDLTYNWEEDRARHWQYVQQGKYPLWMYYMKFEGMSEEEAKRVVAEAKAENQEKGLFDKEE